VPKQQPKSGCYAIPKPGGGTFPMQSSLSLTIDSFVSITSYRQEQGATCRIYYQRWGGRVPRFLSFPRPGFIPGQSRCHAVFVPHPRRGMPRIFAFLPLRSSGTVAQSSRSEVYCARLLLSTKTRSGHGRHFPMPPSPYCEGLGCCIICAATSSLPGTRKRGGAFFVSRTPKKYGAAKKRDAPMGQRLLALYRSSFKADTIFVIRKHG